MPVVRPVRLKTELRRRSSTSSSAEQINYVHVTHANARLSGKLRTNLRATIFVISVFEVFIERVPALVGTGTTLLVAGSNIGTRVGKDANIRAVERRSDLVDPIKTTLTTEKVALEVLTSIDIIDNPGVPQGGVNIVPQLGSATSVVLTVEKAVALKGKDNTAPFPRHTVIGGNANIFRITTGVGKGIIATSFGGIVGTVKSGSRDVGEDVERSTLKDSSSGCVNGRTGCISDCGVREAEHGISLFLGGQVQNGLF